MAINLDINTIAAQVDISTVRVRGRKAAAKKEKTLTGNPTDALIEAVNKVSDFKALRHLVEYMIVKQPQIRYDQVERLARREFPGQTFDAATFMWIKLDYAKNKHLEFGELILEQLKKEKEDTK